MHQHSMHFVKFILCALIELMLKSRIFMALGPFSEVLGTDLSSLSSK